MSMEQKPDLPWWIDGGGEICPFCGQAYAYEMELRCVLCDAPVCPFCASEAYECACPDCAPRPEGES
ncbi:MAG: hypothetical protein K9M82_00155 [Deltaproteobacteria bacterium]|nr:hypothetical protein [Deltaproteobacteria bacterium]